MGVKYARSLFLVGILASLVGKLGGLVGILDDLVVKMACLVVISIFPVKKSADNY